MKGILPFLKKFNLNNNICNSSVNYACACSLWSIFASKHKSKANSEYGSSSCILDIKEKKTGHISSILTILSNLRFHIKSFDIACQAKIDEILPTPYLVSCFFLNFGFYLALSKLSACCVLL